MPSARVLVPSEMLKASIRIWTQVAMSISIDIYYYITSVLIEEFIQVLHTEIPSDLLIHSQRTHKQKQ